MATLGYTLTESKMHGEMVISERGPAFDKNAQNKTEIAWKKLISIYNGCQLTKYIANVLKTI